MLQHKKFTPGEWDAAPVYEGPGSQGKVIVLDFPSLADIASIEEQKGSFRHEDPDDDNAILSFAPLYLGHLPAAFYKVQSPQPEFTSEYVTTRQEILVVIDGVLKLIRDQDYKDHRNPTAQRIMYAGQVIKMEEELVNLEAVSVFSPANCLALAIYADAELCIAGRDLPHLGNTDAWL
jgi:hypothetical protein